MLLLHCMNVFASSRCLEEDQDQILNDFKCCHK